MKYTATGTIKEVFAEFQVSSTFKKREVLIDTSEVGEKPCLIKFEALQDSVECLNNFKAGDPVEVEFYLNGREWTNPQGEVKHFMSAKLTSIKLQGEAPQQAPQQAAPVMQGDAGKYPPMPEGGGEDPVPF